LACPIISKTYAADGTCARRRDAQASPPRIREQSMLDLVMLALGFALFAAALGYAQACERL
jgi:hypothetical protein